MPPTPSIAIAPGDRFGRLTANQRDGSYWLCACDCGKGVRILSASLRRGATRSCGCLLADMNRARVQHGHTRNDTASRTHKSWAGMIQRCTNPRATRHAVYGGRGITVCARWLGSFALFLEDMGERPADHTLDRIDVNGNYEPGNCRWATVAQQAQNRNATKLNADVAADIRWLIDSQGWTRKATAAAMKVSLASLSTVMTGKAWV